MRIYIDTELIDDSYEGDNSLYIKNGGLDQVIEVSNTDETYHFNGFYKTKNDSDLSWMGLSFYDKNYKLIDEKTISLNDSEEFTKFDISATSTNKTRYIQVRVWNDSSSEKGGIVLDKLMLSTNGCYDYVAASSLPPKNMAISQSPQFVVIGFDDNTKSEGIEWAINLFKDKKNHDGSEARVSFYLNTEGFTTWMEDDPEKLIKSVKLLAADNHEIGNHTYDHFKDKNEEYIKELDENGWFNIINKSSNDLVDIAGIDRDKIYGFRAPYLVYTKNTFSVLKSLGFSYDCSIEEGSAQMYDGTNFRWPYQLNQGSPGHEENWYGNPDNPDHISIGKVTGLWELPNHVLMIPNDDICENYGISEGLWDKIKNKIKGVHDHKITGFDYNLWDLAALNKTEVLGILKYNLDLRLKGNRAPFMFGAHTQYYTSSWADTNAENATSSQMREAIEEFVEYALSKKEVRIRPAIDIINWCSNPTPIN